VLVEAMSGDLLTYDHVLADRGSDVPAADLLDRVWFVQPLAAITGNAPRPVPTWDNFSEAYEHLLASRKPLSPEKWAAAAGFAEQAGQSVPVAGILLGMLVAAGWQDSADGNELALLKDDVTTWRTVFLPLARSLMRAKAIWAARPLSKLAIDSLTGVGWQVGDDVQRVRVLGEFRQIEAEARATIKEATIELAWRLAERAASSPDIRIDLAALCWLLGDAPRSGALSAHAGKPALDCAEFVIRRSLAEVARDPFLEVGWQRMAEHGVLDTSEELAPIYYRLTRTSHRQMLALDRAVPAGTAGQMSRLIYENLRTLLSGPLSAVDLPALNHLLNEAKDVLWTDFTTAYLRLVALLLLASRQAAPTEGQHQAERWEWEKLAHGICAALWSQTVNNVAPTSTDVAADLPFHFLPSRSPEELTGALELVEAYRSAGLEYALTVTPSRARPDGEAELRSELRGLRFLQARGRLPAHMRRYYGNPAEIGPGGPLSPDSLFDAERNRARQQQVREELERAGADLYAQPKGYGCMRPDSGRVLIDFRRALGYNPESPGQAADEGQQHEANRDAAEGKTEFDRRLSRGRSLRAAGDLAAARQVLEDAIALAETAYGRDDVRVAEASKVLGNVCQRLGDPGAAKQCFSRALAIDEATRGLFHESVAADRYNLGTTALSLGETMGARVQLERAVGIDTAVYGPQHEEVATDRMTLGEILTTLGEFDRACEQYRKVLAINKEVYGPGHPAVSRAAAALAAAEEQARIMRAVWPGEKGPI
jgi:tetratricopeptide (TPR) repeat protein